MGATFATAWAFVLIGPAAMLLAVVLSRRMGAHSSIDSWLLAGALVVELALSSYGGSVTPKCSDLTEGTLFISNHIGNIVTSASFAVACLYAYVTWSGPTLATWLSMEADETLRYYGLKQANQYVFRDPARQRTDGHAVQIFEGCVDLPLIVKEIRRKRTGPPLDDSRQQDLRDAMRQRQAHWDQACVYLQLGRLKRLMIEGRGDQWLAGGAIWVMIFVTGQALVLFLTEVFVGDQRVACWLANGNKALSDLPIELSYVVAFVALIIGVGLFRFRTMIQALLERSLALWAHDLAQQVFPDQARAAIDKAGKAPHAV